MIPPRIMTSYGMNYHFIEEEPETDLIPSFMKNPHLSERFTELLRA
jgi:hypothetical protein